MKKTLLIVAIAGLAMASCRKDRTCECKTTSDAPGFVSTTTVETWKETTKKDASKGCQSYSVKQTAPVVAQYSYGVDCELK
jgi:hypothetical protein